MNTPIYNAQFITIDFRMLDNREFGEFMKTTAFAVYLQLRRYIWRSRSRRNPIAKVNELYAEGYLVATVERAYLAQKLGIKEERHISRHITELCQMGVIERISTGRQNIYILGKWEDRSVQQDGSYIIELFLLERHFGVEKQPQIIPEEGNAAALSPGEELSGLSASEVSLTDTPEVSHARTSQVSLKRTPGVSKKTPYKYRKNKIEKQQRVSSLLEEFSFSPKQLREIADSYSVERLSEVLKAYRGRSEGKVENPAGWILAALKGEYQFDTAAKRLQARYERQRVAKISQESREAAAAKAQERLAAQVHAWVEEHPEEYQGMLEEERQRWRGTPAGENPSYLQACARVRVQERLSEPEVARPEPAPSPSFVVRPVAAPPSFEEHAARRLYPTPEWASQRGADFLLT